MAYHVYGVWNVIKNDKAETVTFLLKVFDDLDDPQNAIDYADQLKRSNEDVEFMWPDPTLASHAGLPWTLCDPNHNYKNVKYSDLDYYIRQYDDQALLVTHVTQTLKNHNC